MTFYGIFFCTRQWRRPSVACFVLVGSLLRVVVEKFRAVYVSRSHYASLQVEPPKAGVACSWGASSCAVQCSTVQCSTVQCSVAPLSAQGSSRISSVAVSTLNVFGQVESGIKWLDPRECPGCGQHTATIYVVMLQANWFYYGCVEQAR